MKYFNQILKLHLPKCDLHAATAFADAVLPTVNYADSNQQLREKIWQDHFVSKLGEEAVAEVLRQFGCAVLGPDYKIYEGREKSWDSDLFVNDIPLAVKTQTRQSADRYKISWTFQDSEKRRDPILQKPEAWVAFTLVETRPPSPTAWVFPLFQIQDLTFSDPELAHLKGKKQVIYARDLPNLDRSVRQL